MDWFYMVFGGFYDRTGFDRIVSKIKKEERLNDFIIYDKYCAYIQMIEEKINYNTDIYNRNKDLFELSEIAVLIWGLFALSTADFLDKEDEDHMGIVFHSLTTQISNNMLAILVLCNQSLDHQIGIIMRSTCELCFSLLVLMINKKKRFKYFDSVKFSNETEVWRTELRLKDLNDELKRFEDVISNNDTFVSRKLSKFRNEIYKEYSKYTHNTFFQSFINSYSYSEDPDGFMRYNLWGEVSSRVESFLISLCQLNLFTCLDLLQCIVKNIEIKKIVGHEEMNNEFWNDAGFLFLIFKEYCMDKIAKD